MRGATSADCAEVARDDSGPASGAYRIILFDKSVMYIDSLLNGFVCLSILSPTLSFPPSLSTRFPSRGNNAGMIGSRCLAS